VHSRFHFRARLAPSSRHRCISFSPLPFSPALCLSFCLSLSWTARVCLVLVLGLCQSLVPDFITNLSRVAMISKREREREREPRNLNHITVRIYVTLEESSLSWSRIKKRLWNIRYLENTFCSNRRSHTVVNVLTYEFARTSHVSCLNICANVDYSTMLFNASDFVVWHIDVWQTMIIYNK